MSGGYNTRSLNTAYSMFSDTTSVHNLHDLHVLSQQIVDRTMCSMFSAVCFITHRIHVWYIYLHLVDFYGKCRQIYHAWILWVIGGYFSKHLCSSDRTVWITLELQCRWLKLTSWKEQPAFCGLFLVPFLLICLLSCAKSNMQNRMTC